MKNIVFVLMVGMCVFSCSKKFNKDLVLEKQENEEQDKQEIKDELEGSKDQDDNNDGVSGGGSDSGSDGDNSGDYVDTWKIIYRTSEKGNSNTLRDCDKDDSIRFSNNKIYFYYGELNCSGEVNYTVDYHIKIENKVKKIITKESTYIINSLSDKYLEIVHDIDGEKITDTYKR